MTRITEENLHGKLQLKNEKVKHTDAILRLNTELAKLSEDLCRLQTENNQLKLDCKSFCEESEAKTCSLEKEVEELKNQLARYGNIPFQHQVSINNV